MSSDTPVIARRGLMLVLSSPSGAGKTTLSRKLLETEDEQQILSAIDRIQGMDGVLSVAMVYHQIDD